MPFCFDLLEADYGFSSNDNVGSKAMADLPPPAMGMRRRDEVPSRSELPKQIGNPSGAEEEKEASLTRLQEGSKNMK